MVYHLGVRTGKISMNEFVQLVSTNPARIFGLYPRKGAISIGSDADLVLWDPSVEAVVSASGRHSNIDYNLFEDVEVFGGPVLVTVRGKVIVDRGAVLRGQPGDGMFVRRSSVTDPRTVEVIAPVQ
jgi:dihydropyrimidinase